MRDGSGVGGGGKGERGQARGMGKREEKGVEGGREHTKDNEREGRRGEMVVW